MTIHKVDNDKDSIFIRLAATDEVLAKLPYRHGLVIMVTHGNMLHHSEQRADDYIAGVLAGMSTYKLVRNGNAQRAAAAG